MEALVVSVELLAGHPLLEINAGAAPRTEISRHFLSASCEGLSNVRLDSSFLVLPSAPSPLGVSEAVLYAGCASPATWLWVGSGRGQSKVVPARHVPQM